VAAVVIVPVMVDGQFAVPAGATVRGVVEKAVESARADQRSVLVVSFTEIEIGGTRLKMAAQVAGVDNAREKVAVLFSGHVESLALVDRPGVPRHSQNATGDNLETDGKIAVVVLKQGWACPAATGAGRRSAGQARPLAAAASGPP
jgi:hypothetical protein